MTRISIFGTKRPDLGNLIRFDTPGENETQLNEDEFERRVKEYFDKNNFFSKKRVTKILQECLPSGDIIDYFKAFNRSFELMNGLPEEKYYKTHLGYVKR
jgi:hypothetical protein